MGSDPTEILLISRFSMGFSLGSDSSEVLTVPGAGAKPIVETDLVDSPVIQSDSNESDPIDLSLTPLISPLISLI